jgi:hypothetical protein
MISLFGLPSRRTLSNLPNANPRNIKVATTNDANVNCGMAIPDRMVAPPKSIRELVPRTSFSRFTSFSSLIPEFFA